MFLYYFGRKGGGSLFTYRIAEFLLTQNLQFSLCISSHNIEIEKFEQLFYRSNCIDRLLVLDFKSPLSLFNYSVKKKKDSSIIVGLMMHPYDAIFLILHRSAKRIQIIHEAITHYGERYPPTSLIMRRARNSNAVVTLSNFVSKQLTAKKIQNQVIEYKVSKVEIASDLSRNKLPTSILIFGRHKKYQGFEIVEKLVSHRSLAHINWVILGGRTYSEIQDNKNVRQHSGWIPEDRIDAELRYCNLVLIPYCEGSQSGVAFRSILAGKPVVCTPVGGIPEQIIEGVTGVVSKSREIDEICDAILRCLELRPFNVSAKDEYDFEKRLVNLIEEAR
jgi:glycosyltransferase involved in cell wall biosynthesis